MVEFTCSVCEVTAQASCWMILRDQGWFIDWIGQGGSTMCPKCYEEWKEKKNAQSDSGHRDWDTGGS